MALLVVGASKHTLIKVYLRIEENTSVRAPLMNITHRNQKCHCERSKEVLVGQMRILRCVQNDIPDLD